MDNGRFPAGEAGSFAGFLQFAQAQAAVRAAILAAAAALRGAIASVAAQALETFLREAWVWRPRCRPVLAGVERAAKFRSGTASVCRIRVKVRDALRSAASIQAQAAMGAAGPWCARPSGWTRFFSGESSLPVELMPGCGPRALRAQAGPPPALRPPRYAKWRPTARGRISFGQIAYPDARRAPGR